MTFVAELKSKRVFRAVIAYGVVAFTLLQVIEPIMHGLHLPDSTLTWTLLTLAAALPVVVAAAWLTDRRQPSAKLQAGWVAAAVLLLAAIAVWMATRHREARAPTLAQLTFEGGVAEYPAWSPDGKQLAYAAQSGAVRKIFRKDVHSGGRVQVTHGEFDEIHPAWTPDGKRLVFMRAQKPGEKLQPGDVFGEFGNADVWQVEAASGKESLLIPNASDPALAPDGRIAVDARWAGPQRIWLLDSGGQNPQQITTDSSEEASHTEPRFSRDGTKIAFQVQLRTKFDVRVVDVQTKHETSITDDFALDVQPAWSRRFIYFTSDRGGGYNIWRAPAEGGALQQVTTGAGQDVQAAFSPDGSDLAFTTLRQNADLFRLPVDPVTGLATGEPQAVVATTREESRGAWSPDGSAIAFNSDRTGEMNIWVHALADGADRQLTFGKGGDFQPNWSPDAKRIVFFSSRLGRPRIFVAGLADAAVKPLTSGSGVEVNPFYSPDGKWVAFQSDRTGRSEVWVIPSGGGEERQLSHEGVIGHFMRWTDDSSTVIFSCRCGGHRSLAKLPLDGGELVRLLELNVGSHMSFSPDRTKMMDVQGHRALTVYQLKTGAPQKVYEFADPSSRIDYPVWSPDGKWVLFEKNRPEGGDVWVMRDVEPP